MSDRPRFEILIDGQCPVCRAEANMLRRMDRGRGRLRVTDIAASNFRPEAYGRTLDELMARIHGVTPGGDIVEGVEVFRRAYAAVGWGWLLAPTRWPIIRPIANAGYRWFARNRVRLFGGGLEACESGRCGTARI